MESFPGRNIHSEVLSALNVRKRYPLKRTLLGRYVDFVDALCGVSVMVGKGETVGVIGESGCGKSTLAKVLLDLDRPDSGEVLYRGKPINGMSDKDYKVYRRNVQAVFQNPQMSLNPRMKIWEIVVEGLVINERLGKRELFDRAKELISLVGMDIGVLSEYPHELSGGQKQRVAIARALAMLPEIIIADEPTSSLDVSVQSQIINLFQDLQEKMGTSYLFISHSIPVVEAMSDRVLVLYRGYVVEEGRTSDLFPVPAHPYTKMLLECVPSPGKRLAFKGTNFSEGSPSKGCPFYNRCLFRKNLCMEKIPDMVRISSTHKVRCFLFY